MRDEHQTSPIAAQSTPLDSAREFTPLDGSMPPAYLNIQLRTAKPTPLPDPFQFSVYLAQLANTAGSK